MLRTEHIVNFCNKRCIEGLLEIPRIAYFSSVRTAY